MKYLIYAAIIIGIAAFVFGKIVIPIWMDLEDAKYERDKKKEAKAKSAQRTERFRSEYQKLSEITAAYKNEEYRKAVELLEHLLQEGLAGKGESSISCLYYGADSLRRIAATPDEWETAFYWAVTGRQYAEDHVRYRKASEREPFELVDEVNALPDKILNEGKHVLQATYAQLENGAALMEAGSFRKALEFFESAAKAGSRIAAERVMKLQLWICGTQQDVPVLDACLERCRTLKCINIEFWSQEVSWLKERFGKSGIIDDLTVPFAQYQKERLCRRSCDKAAAALKNSKSQEVKQEAHRILQELASVGHAPARVALSQYEAERGDLESQLYLASVYESGLDNQKADAAKAQQWYRKAADNGSGYACYRMYELTGEEAYLQRGKKLGGSMITEAEKLLAQTADETPTAYNFTRVQHALALRVQSKLPIPYYTDMQDDTADAIIRDVDKYAEIDAKFRGIPQIKDWSEKEQFSGWDCWAKLKSIYAYYHCTEKDGPERSKDIQTIVRAINLYEIYIRIVNVYLHDDYSVMRDIARLYLPYNKEEAKSSLDKGIARSNGACLMEAYDRYETYGYEWYDVSRYRDRAISLGYQPAISSARAEAQAWEREKDAMLRERYVDPVAEKRRKEEERAQRKKELDEKLDLLERLTSNDGFTNEEKYQLGKRDVYDHVRDELFREALYEDLD